MRIETETTYTIELSAQEAGDIYSELCNVLAREPLPPKISKLVALFRLRELLVELK